MPETMQIEMPDVGDHVAWTQKNGKEASGTVKQVPPWTYKDAEQTETVQVQPDGNGPPRVIALEAIKRPVEDTEDDDTVDVDVDAEGVPVRDEEVPISSYGLNHPKNYLGYVAAFYIADGDTEQADELCEMFVVGSPDVARRGAMNMGLIESPARGEYRITERGRDVVDPLLERAEGDGVLVMEWFEDAKGKRTRFTDLYDGLWETSAVTAAQGDPAFARLIELMQYTHREYALDEYPLSFLIEILRAADPEFAADYFLVDDSPAFDVEDATVYRSAAVHQMKTMLYHLGVLTETGTQRHKLDPTDDVWALEEGLRP